VSIAGIWPLAGFWSKDEILASALNNQPILFYLAMATVFMTAFYMFRVVFMTFGGKYKGGSSNTPDVKPHESSNVMVAPMVILALLAIGSGWFNVTGGFSQLLGHGETYSFVQGFFGILGHPLPWISLMMAGSGILLAYAIYSKNWLSAKRIGKLFAPLHTLFFRKYWLDELYEDIIARKILSNNIFASLRLFDSKGIDGVVNGAANTVLTAGRAIRKVQTGQLQLYGMFIILGVLALAIGLIFWG
jgi:NADH-quinone oxidoreductase subunit L